MRVLLLFFCASVLFGQGIGADGPRRQVERLDAASLELARQWITDARPLYRAWAAELIRRNNAREMGPALVAALGGVDEFSLGMAPNPDAEDSARLSILDALIQVGYPVSKEVSLGLLRRYPAQALILLYRAGCPETATSLFVLQDSSADTAWLLAAECLAAPGGAIELVKRLHIQGTVQVLDQEKPVWWTGSGLGLLGIYVSSVSGRRSEVDTHALNLRSEWPDVFTYTLNLRTNSPGSGVRLTPENAEYEVVYTREYRWTTWRQTDWQRHGDRSEYVLGILARKIGLYRGRPLSLELAPSAKLHWTTAEQYRLDLQAFATEQQRRYGELTSALIERGLLTAAERDQCHLSLEILVDDLRLNRTVQIPILGIGDRLR
jgi:hypothetical protein